MSTLEHVASIQSGTPTSGVKADSALWEMLSEARDANEFCQAWLSLQCGFINGAAAGLLLIDDGDGHFSSAAAWPDHRRDLSYLTDTAQKALAQRTSFVNQSVTPGAAANTVQVGQPIETAGRLKGVVVVDLRRQAGTDVSAVIRELRWGIGWLELLFGRQQIEQDSSKLARTNFALKILAGANEHKSFRAATLSVANELASRLNCSRVSIGFSNRKGIKLAAISNSAVFNQKTSVVSALENAMEEASDQNASIAVPPCVRTQRRIALAHESLATRFGAESVVSVPMTNGVRSIGVILLERDRNNIFDDNTIELLEAVAALVGPGLDIKRESNKLIAGRAARNVRSMSNALFGEGRPTIKLATIAAIMLAGYLALAHGDFRVSAKALVEGSIQRAVVAPYDGYIATAPVRAGDIVDAGQVLATIDDRDLKLEAARWKSERDQQVLKYNDAMAKRDRSAALVMSASLDQTQAQLSLVEDRLARSTITAPFRGVVVSGDLRQLLGSPLEKGKILFEIAPLESFRVILQVDERDVAYLAEGQSGTLVLTGLSSESVPFKVKTITPVATASEGRNHFRVEADVQGAALALRPGMEGIGKISIDRRSLLSIWTRSLTDWLRITAWKWLP